MHYIHKVGCTSVRQVPVAGTCSFRLTTQICVFQKLRSTGYQTCGFPTDIPVLTHRLPRLMLSLIHSPQRYKLIQLPFFLSHWSRSCCFLAPCTRHVHSRICSYESLNGNLRLLLLTKVSK